MASSKINYHQKQLIIETKITKDFPNQMLIQLQNKKQTLKQTIMIN